MKKSTIQLFSGLILLPLLFLSSCELTPYQRVAGSAPIMPVRLAADTTTIYVTDYVPLLAATDSTLPETMVIMDDGRIEELTFNDSRASVQVPILPNLPVQFGFYTVECTDNSVTLAFTKPVSDVQVVGYVQNRRLDEQCFAYNEDGSITVSHFPTYSERTFLRFYASDGNYLYNDILIPLQHGAPVTDAQQLNRHDNQAQVLYSLLVDRFANGLTSNDWKMNSPEVLDIVDYQGGDLVGITKKIEEGFFDDLGINTIWVSPITQNPWDAWGKYVFKNGNKYDSSKSYTKFSGYHGYWPIYATKLEERFGTDEELKTLLSTAHAHQINVVLDYVANHMHINSPTYKMHPNWHTDSILPDGRRNFELWDEARLTTWFDVHIPTLDLEREDVCQPMTDSALYWLEHYDLDGFRHDACKHIPECYWRLLGQKIALRHPERPIWMIGETYGNPQLIGLYVKSGMLNAQFDFNVYYAILNALCNNGSMRDVARNIQESLVAYGSHHTMGNISGNHDQVRFASLAGGAILPWSEQNGKEDGWTRHVGIGDATVAYKRAILQEVMNMTLPGVPCIYQGDEYAEVGGNDPDNRHMMRFDEELDDAEKAYKEEVKRLIKMRRTSMPLLYGDFQLVEVSDDVLVYDRVYMGETVRVTIDKAQLMYKVEKVES